MFLRAGLLVLCLGAIAQGVPRIIGGNDAPNHKYPYQVSFRRNNKGHFCSGSILNERWILSAAHCFENRDIKAFTVSAGTNFLNEAGTVYLPELFVIHEDYTTFYYDDIALVRVTSDILFNDFVQPIALPNQDLQDYSKRAVFSGWGSTKLDGPAPNKLQEIYLNVLTYERCKEQQFAITDAHICTLTTYGEGICHGDSGGPLVVDGVQVGIASYVNPCAINYPDVYTRVWSHRKWIDSTMEKIENISRSKYVNLVRSL